jgi:hypothetical protein
VWGSLTRCKRCHGNTYIGIQAVAASAAGKAQETELFEVLYAAYDVPGLMDKVSFQGIVKTTLLMRVKK